MALVFTTGFLAVFGLPGAAPPHREKTARFPCGAGVGTIGGFRPLADIRILLSRSRMVIRAAQFVVVFTCALTTATTNGAQLPPIAFLSMGFREATMADFASGPQASERRADPRGYLAVSADFNGDGKVDEARILLNEQRRVAYVVAVIQSPSKVDTYVLSQMDQQDAQNVGITLAKPLDANQSRGLSGLKIFALDTGQGEANYFDGEEFRTRAAVAAPSAKTI